MSDVGAWVVLGTAALVAWVVVDGVLRVRRGESPRVPGGGGPARMVVIAAATPVLLAALAHCAFAAPWADDFSYAVASRARGFWAAQVNWYLGWSGRFAATALLSLPSCVDAELQPFVRAVYALNLLGLVSGVAALASALGASRRSALGVAIAVSVAVVDGLASPAENLYWLAGTVTYTTPLVLMCWVFVMLLSAVRREGRARLGLYAAACCTAFVAAGFSELVWVPGLGALVLASSLARRSRAEWRAYAAAAAMFAAGAAASALAPGNAVRGAANADGGSFELACRGGLDGLLQMVDWAQRPVVACAVITFGPLAAVVARRWRARPQDVALVGLWLVTSLVSAWAGPGLSLGVAPPPRGVGAAWIVFVFGAVALVLTSASASAGVARALERVPSGATRLGAALLVVGLYSGPGGGFVADLGSARELEAVLDARAAALQRARNGGTAELPVMPLDSYTVVYEPSLDVSADPEHWVNRSVAGWFRVRAVVVAPAARLAPRGAAGNAR